MVSLTGKTRSWYRVGASLFRSKPEQTRADRRLAIQIATVLEASLTPSETESLSFYVRECNVTLFGTICRPQSRAFITALLQRVPGVCDVNDHLQLVAYEEVF